MLTALLPFELCFFTLSQPAFLALIFSAKETSASIPHAAVPTEISLRTRGTGHAAQISWGFFHKSIWAYKPFGKRWAGYPKINVRDIGKMLCPSQPTNQSDSFLMVGCLWSFSAVQILNPRSLSDERGNISNNHDPRQVASLWWPSAGPHNILKLPIRARWRHFPPQRVAMLLNLSHAKCHVE